MEKVKRHQVYPVDALMSYGAGLVILLFIGGTFYEKLGFYGLAVTQVSLIIVPMLLIKLRGDHFKDALSLNVPQIKHLLGSLFIWLGLFFVVNGVTQLLMPLSDYNQEVAQELAKMTYHPNLMINLLVVAALPAICEEILFRGLIFKSFSNRYTPEIGLILSSVLFGILHFDWIRVVPTTILGFGIGYVVYRSGSIFLGMLMHYINNGLVVITTHLTKPMIDDVEVVVEMESMWQGALIFIAMGAVIAWIGTYFFRERPKGKKESID